MAGGTPMRLTLNLGVTALILAFSVPSFPWGATGHRVSAEMGQRNLTKAAAKKCVLLLGGYSLADVANYLDEIRSDDNPPPTPLHFVNMDADTYQQSTKNPEGDVVVAIQVLFEYLKTKNAGALDRLPKLKEKIKNESDALVYFEHYMGDLHQPMHVGKPADEGGSQTKVVFMGRSASLHSVWDELMIDETRLSYTEFTQLLNHVKPDQRKAWENPNNLSIPDLIVSWANESWQITKNLAYNFPDSQRPAQPGQEPPLPYLSYKYIGATRETLREQLAKGGIRLAYLLNLIYGQ